MKWTSLLTHWGRVMHICISKLTITGSGNGLLPSQRQAIIWTNDGILLTRHLATNFSEILIEIHTFSFKKMHLKMSSGEWWPFCLSLNVLMAARSLIFWTKINWTSSEFKACISNYIYIKWWIVITHPCPNFNGTLPKLILKLGHGWVMTFQRK